LLFGAPNFFVSEWEEEEEVRREGGGGRRRGGVIGLLSASF
jgi:hypothetical protein